MGKRHGPRHEIPRLPLSRVDATDDEHGCECVYLIVIFVFCAVVAEEGGLAMKKNERLRNPSMALCLLRFSCWLCVRALQDYIMWFRVRHVQVIRWEIFGMLAG